MGGIEMGVLVYMKELGRRAKYQCCKALEVVALPFLLHSFHPHLLASKSENSIPTVLLFSSLSAVLYDHRYEMLLPPHHYHHHHHPLPLPLPSSTNFLPTPVLLHPPCPHLHFTPRVPPPHPLPRPQHPPPHLRRRHDRLHRFFPTTLPQYGLTC